MKWILLLFGFLLQSTFSFAQLNSPDSTQLADRHFHVALQAMTFVVHTFRTSNPQRYDLKLDKAGFVVFVPGVVAKGDWYFWRKKPKMHLRFEGSWYKDSGFNDAAYIHVGLRRDFFKREGKKFYVSAGLGPGFFVRENWNKLYPYRVKDPFYGERETKNRAYQYRFFPLAGDIDLLWALNEKWEFDLAIVPAVPAAVIFKVGARYQL